MTTYTCPDCGGQFDEPASITEKDLQPGTGIVQYDALGCAWCGRPLKGTRENPRVVRSFGKPPADDGEEADDE